MVACRIFIENCTDKNQFFPSSADSLSPESTTMASSASLRDVAIRFKERTVQLGREKSLLQQTQRSLDDLETAEKQKKRQRAFYRREFVQARQERDFAEGEALVLQEKTTALGEEIQWTRKKIEDFKSGSQNENERQQCEIEEALIIPHRARRGIYLDYLQGRVDTVKQTEHNREAKRKQLAQAVALLHESRGVLQQRKDQVEQQIREKSEAMLRETAEGQHVAAKVRTALEERKQLREDLRRAKDRS